MAKYYYRCEGCEKQIKKQLGYTGPILCKDCKKVKKNCLNCGKELNTGYSIRKYCSKSCSSKHSLRGRTLSNEHKESLSKAAWNNKGNGYAKVRYYTVYCPYMGKNISVQGTYELRYAEYLNKNNILWKRDKSVSLQYKRNKSDIVRNYYPDFYLIKEDVYVETKGYFSETDKLKMKLVMNQNPTKTINILFKEDLEKFLSLYGEETQHTSA